jgi:uncharacterized protein (TIRG00374 family)
MDADRDHAAQARLMRSLWLKLLISAALLAWLLARTPLHALAHELGRLDAATLAAGAALSVAAWLLSALRWWCIAPGFALATVVRMTFIGLLYGTLLPGQVAGDVVKAWRLSPSQKSRGQAAAVTLVDRGVATLALFAIGAAAAMALPRVPAALRLLFPLATLAIAAGGLVLSATPMQNLLNVWLRSRGEGRIAPLFAFLLRLSQALHQALRQPLRIALSFALALLFHALCIAIHLLLARALGLSLDAAAWCLVYAGVSLLMLLPVSVAGIGLREGGYVGLLALFGVSREAALTVSLVLFAYTILGALIGVLFELEILGRKARAKKNP